MRKKIIVLVIAIAAVIISWIAISEFLLKGTLKVTVSGNGNDITLTITRSDGVAIKEAVVQAGDTVTIRSKPDTFAIDAKNTEGETLASAIVKRASTTTVDVHISPELKANKVGTGSLGCDIWQGQTLVSYGCARETLVLAHTPARQTFVKDKQLSGGYMQVGGARSYNGGILTQLRENDSVTTVHIKGGATTHVTTPSDGQAIYSILVDPSTESGKFVLADVTSKSAYIYTGIADKQPRKIELPVDDDERVSIAFSIVNDTLYMITGQTDLTGDYARKDELSDDITVYSFSLSSGSQTNKQVIGSDKMNYATTIRDQAFVVQNSKHLLVYTANSQTPVFTALNTDSFVSLNNTLYFVKDNAVFAYNVESGQAQRAFSSGHLRISVLSPSLSGPVFNAMIDGSGDDTLYSYLITQFNQTGKRPEDTLPYDPINLSTLPIIRMDYTADSITVQLALNSFYSDRATGKIGYDTAEFNAKKQLVLNRIHQDGIAIPDSNIFFVP